MYRYQISLTNMKTIPSLREYYSEFECLDLSAAESECFDLFNNCLELKRSSGFHLEHLQKYIATFRNIFRNVTLPLGSHSETYVRISIVFPCSPPTSLCEYSRNWRHCCYCCYLLSFFHCFCYSLFFIAAIMVSVVIIVVVVAFIVFVFIVVILLSVTFIVVMTSLPP